MAARKKAPAKKAPAKKKTPAKKAVAAKPEPLKRFESEGQRVKIIGAADKNLNGKLGTVRRRRIGDDGAWIEVDGAAGESRVMLFPEECAKP